MDQPTTSTAMEEEQQLKVENIGTETMKLLKRLIWKIKLGRNTTEARIPLSDPVSRTARYTGMNKINVERILAFGETLKYEHIEIDRKVIHKKLTNMYVNHNLIPSITELFNSLDHILPVHVNLEYFTRVLIKMGYVFYKFPRRRALLVMEKKTVTFERYRYLKSIQQYRKDKAHIVYIGLASLSSGMELVNLEQTLQTNVNNILNHIFFTASNESVDNIKVIPASTYEALKTAIKDWLVEIFTLQILPPGTVCVLEDSKISRDTLYKVPTWKSVKTDMVEWLEEHNVPCDMDMSKADLLHLVETCTDTNKNTFVIDNLVKPHNYVLLRLPQSINGLSIAAAVIKFCNKNESLKYGYTRIKPSEVFNYLSVTDIKKISNCLIVEEQQQLKDDIKLDEILDELIRKMKTKILLKDYKEDDLLIPTFSDSD